MLFVVTTYPSVVVSYLIKAIVGEVSSREKVVQAVTKVLIRPVRVVKWQSVEVSDVLL